MVQRKVIRVQGDHVKRHHHESKARADLKKKMMKKSASMKRSELESLRSGSLTTRVGEKQPGRPPPAVAADVVVTPQKQSSPASPMAKTPNYMKSTTSSDARNKQSRVSFKSPSSDCSSLRTKCLNSSKFKTSGCEIKATKTINSLKTMRTLTKNSSFKVARASVRKCSPVVLCENLESQRPTCSSTLKDCKFPAYLSLNPGGTESEGTSAIKVCPYSYCSLNGHHHPPLPPLKCFLSARRRMVKAQRGIKLGCLSSRRGNGEKLGDDFKKSPRISPESEEGHKGFFADIFCVDDGPDKTSTVDDEDSGEDMVLDSTICGSVNACESLDENVDWYSIEIISAHPVSGDECVPGAVVETNLDDEVMADEVSLRSFDEESLKSDAFSGVNDRESACLYDYLQGLNDVPQETEPEQEPACDNDRDDTEIGLPISNQGTTEEGNSIDEDKKFLQKEDSISATADETIASAGEVISDSTGNSATTSLVHLAFESNTEAATPKHDGAGCHKAGKVKSKDEIYSEAEDIAMARLTSKTKNPVEESDDLGLFNPRPPNFLPVEADPEAEKVDLRHQELDERRNTEEWMVDYALRQVVAKLRPGRKRKVALLVEAFEKVSPITKCELQLSHNPVFGLPSPIQACR